MITKSCFRGLLLADTDQSLKAPISLSSVQKFRQLPQTEPTLEILPDFNRLWIGCGQTVAGPFLYLSIFIQWLFSTLIYIAVL